MKISPSLANGLATWILHTAQHDEYYGKCYGLISAGSKKEHTCKCGLDELKQRIRNENKNRTV